MRFIECQQGSAEWLSARAGVITASRFADAISTVGGLNAQQQQYVDAVRTGMPIKEAMMLAAYKSAPTSEAIRRALAGEQIEQPSDVAKRYAADLAFERISGMPHGEPVKTWVLERGHQMETIARRLYEARTGAFVTEAGLCVTDDGIFGYSTDGLVDDDGLIEVKSLTDTIKIMGIWRTGDVSEFLHQMMGGKWITGRKWCDYLLYVPELKTVGKDLYIKRIWRDEELIDPMVNRLAKFNSLVQVYEQTLRAAA